MTVSELIRELKKKPKNMNIKIESFSDLDGELLHHNIVPEITIVGNIREPAYVLLESKIDDPDRKTL